MTLPTATADRLTARIESCREEMIHFQCDLTAVTSLGPDNGGDGELPRAEFILRRARAFGLPEAVRVDAPDPRVNSGIRPNIIIRLAGETAVQAVWVLAHMDTVPPGERSLWSGDPFVARVEEGRIVGRGVEDNQQGLTAGLFALRALVDEGVVPVSDACLALVADEETGNAFGLEHLLAAAPDLISPDDLVVVPDAGSPDGAAIEVAEKTTLWVEFTVRGRQVHSSIPDAGINAARAAAHLTVRLDRGLPAAFPGRDDVFDVPRSTFEPTRHDANVPNVNTIPGEEHFYFDCRVLPQYPVAEVKKAIEVMAAETEAESGCAVEIAYPACLSAAPPTPVDAPVVTALSRAIRHARGIEPHTVGIGGGTVAAALRRRGIPAVVWATLEETAHSPDEYCLVDNMVADAVVLARLFAGER